MAPSMEESKTAVGDDVPFIEELAEDVPFIEELTEEELAREEMKTQDGPPELSPEEEDELVETLRHQNMLKGIKIELDNHDKAGKEGYINGKFNYAYNEYKTGLKALSDLIVGHEARENPDLKAMYQFRRRKFCINVAAACIKIRHFHQGLEACTLVLDEGPDDDMQRRKALFRAGVCAQGMGELDAAHEFLTKLLNDTGIDERTQRDVKKQLRGVAQEKKRYKKFAREMCSKKNVESIIMPDKTKAPSTDEEIDKMAELEQNREKYLKNQKSLAELNERERKEKTGESSPKSVAMPPRPEVMISEEDCIAILDTLSERYADSEVQEALKQASLDHNLNFSKGYIIKSKQILSPLQKDIFETYGFWDNSENAKSSTDKASVASVKAPDISEFEESVDDLVLIGAGVREKPSEEVKRFESRKMYSVAVYASDDAKAKIISDMSSLGETESSSPTLLRKVLKSSKQAIFLLNLDVELSVHEMSGEILSLVSPSNPDGRSLAECSSLMFAAGEGMENNMFPPGTTFKLECGEKDVTLSVIDNEVGVAHGLAEAFCDGFLDQETVGPSLYQSVMQYCCNKDTTEIYLKAAEAKDKNAKVANAKAHDQALRKMQQTIRYLSKSNKVIARKMDECTRLAIGELVLGSDGDGTLDLPFL